jgi:hypothetical protein
VEPIINPSNHVERPSTGIPEQARPETTAGYVEWLRDDQLIADGQRVRWDNQTRMKLGRLASIASVPLGYEIKVTGVRAVDGALLAQQLEVKPNGIAAFESQVIQDNNALEAAWTREGIAYFPDANRNQHTLGRIADAGPDVERARRILDRLVPPYVSASRLRLRVIYTRAWNACAMENGAIWVNKGLRRM